PGPTAARVRPATALPDDRDASRRRRHAGTNARLLGRSRLHRKTGRALGPGHAARVHRDRRRLAGAAPIHVQLLGPSARRRAPLPTACLPGVLSTYTTSIRG